MSRGPYWELSAGEPQEEHYTYFIEPDQNPDDMKGKPNTLESRWYRASVKWDGCVEFERYFNGPIADVERHKDQHDIERMHICDLDDAIARLTELRAKAKAYFTEKRGEWPG